MNRTGTAGSQLGLRAIMMPAPARAHAHQIDHIHRQQCLEQAARCRRLAYSLSDQEALRDLLSIAADFERNAWSAGHR